MATFISGKVLLLLHHVLVFADFIEIESSMGYNDITDNLHEDTKDAM